MSAKLNNLLVIWGGLQFVNLFQNNDQFSVSVYGFIMVCEEKTATKEKECMYFSSQDRDTSKIVTSTRCVHTSLSSKGLDV